MAKVDAEPYEFDPRSCALVIIDKQRDFVDPGGFGEALGNDVSLVCFLGLTALLLAVVPLVAILPILLYVGLVIGAQAFQASPQNHAPAVVLAIIPNVAAWGQLQVDSALNAAATSAAQVGGAKLAGSGLVYHGMELLGGGACSRGSCSARWRHSSSIAGSPRRACRAGKT